MGPVLDRTPIPERLMRPPVVLPLDPVANRPSRLIKRLEGVLPGTLFFQAPKAPFDQPILLRRVRRDELLRQTIVQV